MVGARREDLEQFFEQTAQRFHLLADPTRLRILLLLDQEGEMNVTELHHALGIGQPGASYQLNLLRLGRIVDSRREGKCVHYRLASQEARDLLRLACRLVESAEGES
jgi:ArsR family transcriptional regulator